MKNMEGILENIVIIIIIVIVIIIVVVVVVVVIITTTLLFSLCLCHRVAKTKEFGFRVPCDSSFSQSHSCEFLTLLNPGEYSTKQGLHIDEGFLIRISSLSNTPNLIPVFFFLS